VAKWLKHSTADQKIPGSNLTCCFTPWETSLWLKWLGGKNQQTPLPYFAFANCFTHFNVVLQGC